MFRENNRLLLVVIDTAESAKKKKERKWKLSLLSLSSSMIPVLVLFSKALYVYSCGHACTQVRVCVRARVCLKREGCETLALTR